MENADAAAVNPDGEVIAYVRPGCTCPDHYEGHAPTCPAVALLLAPQTVGWYEVKRFGKPKREGGPGVKWTCSCNGVDTTTGRYNDGPDAHGAPYNVCRHLRALFTGNVVEVDDPTAPPGPALADRAYYVHLMPAAEELLRPKWAADALRTTTGRR
jgi:hypothetical protein